MANLNMARNHLHSAPPISNKNPIMSYGILLFHIDDDNKIWYLLAQRRDTIEYADFIRGRYSYSNLETYFSLMTVDERNRLQNYSFDQLWDDLWVNHDSKFYREVRPRAKAKYESQRHLTEKLLDKTSTTILEPGWGFPKGKKNPHETEIECSFREFKEETKMSIDYVNLLNISPSTEVFKGSNGKMYSTVYYIAQVEHKIPIVKIPTYGLRSETISEEISNLRWCTRDSAAELLTPWRTKLLAEAEEKILEYLADFSIRSNKIKNDPENILANK